MTGLDIPLITELPNKEVPIFLLLFGLYLVIPAGDAGQSIAPHLRLSLAVRIQVLPKLFFRESDHKVGLCPSGCFTSKDTRF